MDLGSGGDAHVINDNSMPVGADGNNVDLDIQMGKLSANSRHYQEALNLLGAQLKFIKAGISGRGVG
jgi:flagellar basal body rod protein FlgB